MWFGITGTKKTPNKPRKTVCDCGNPVASDRFISHGRYLCELCSDKFHLSSCIRNASRELKLAVKATTYATKSRDFALKFAESDPEARLLFLSALSSSPSLEDVLITLGEIQDLLEETVLQLQTREQIKIINNKQVIKLALALDEQEKRKETSLERSEGKRAPKVYTVKRPVGRPAKPVMIDQRLWRIPELKEGGQTLEQIGKKYNVSGERVRQILLRWGFWEMDSKKEKNSPYPLTSDEMLVHEQKLKRLAFKCGVSAAELVKLRQRIGQDRYVRLRTLLRTTERNRIIVKNYKGDSLMQMSILELLEVYMKEGKKLFPDLSVTQAVDKVLSPKSGYVLSRKDFSQPYIPNNVHLVTRKEFGRIFGLEFGWGAQARKKTDSQK